MPYADGNPVSNTDPLGLFITSVDAACAIDPNFCARIFGQITENAATISGDACLQEAADAVRGGLRAAAIVATVLPIVRGIPENIGPYSAKAPRQVAPGVKTLEGHYMNDLGRVELWHAHYDEYGRQIGRTEYNAGNRAADIPDTHNHLTEYNEEYPLGHSAADHVPGEYPK